MTRRKSQNEQATGDHQKTVTALRTLFDLLENYAPAWYTQEHHDLASEALKIESRRQSPSAVKPRLKERRRVA